MTVKEYNVGQLFTTAEVSRSETGGGEGIEILENQPFDLRDPQCSARNPDPPLLNGDPAYSVGQYTYKKIFLTK